MADAVEAIYEHGVFRPLRPVGLEEGQRVILSVETEAHTPQDVASQLAGWRAVFEGLTDEDIAEFEQMALDRSHFIIERNGKRA